MSGQVTKRILVRTVFLCLASGLQADITFPGQAPLQVDAQIVRVWRGKQTTISLRAHYSGGGTVTFSIVQRPEHGTLSGLRILSGNRATITYENDGAESVASDGFRYIARTGNGQTSSPAEVRITVEEAPARMALPDTIEFGEIMAGESASRSFAIKNDGGGELAGALSVSAPWRLTATEYRVKSGETGAVEVSFRPDEGRKFVGQITLVGVDGVQHSVPLEGTALAPVRVEPDPLRIEAPQAERDPRTGFVSLTNETERALRLTMAAGSKIEPIPEIALAPHETKKIPIAILLHREIPLHEEVAFVGANFKTRLQIDAEAALAAPAVAGKGSVARAGFPVVVPSATLAAKPLALHPAAEPAAPPRTAKSVLVDVRVQRPDASHWELRWARPEVATAKYRIDERFLTLNPAGELQINWHSLAPPEIIESDGEVIARLEGVDPKQLHMLRVTALAADGATLWESSPIALKPPGDPSPRASGWRVFFGLALLVFVFLRWRAQRTAA